MSPGQVGVAGVLMEQAGLGLEPSHGLVGCWGILGCKWDVPQELLSISSLPSDYFSEHPGRLPACASEALESLSCAVLTAMDTTKQLVEWRADGLQGGRMRARGVCYVVGASIIGLRAVGLEA